MSVSLDFLEILGRRKKNKISQGGVWADLTPPFVTPPTKKLNYSVENGFSDVLGLFSQCFNPHDL